MLQTDASKDGLGACITQNSQPIAYSSRSLTEAEKNFAQIEKELLAIVYGMEKYHQYVYGNKVTVQTDHKPLISIVKKEISQVTSRLQRMMLKLIKYDLNVIYVPGKDMYLADTLSRAYLKDPVENDPELENIVHTVARHLAVSPNKKKKLQEATKSDETLQMVIKYHKNGWPKSKWEVHELALSFWSLQSQLEMDEDLLFLNHRLIIPQKLRHRILSDLHAGHQGMEKLKIKARDLVYWPGITKDIEQIVKACKVCEKFQASNQKEPLIPHSIPERAWQKIASDILEFQGTSYLILIDYYSNWLEIKELKGKTALCVITQFKEIFARNGIPQELISDNMPYNSYQLKEFAEEWDIVLTTSSPTYAQSNGLAERGVQLAKNMLRKAHEERTDIYTMLMEYRNTPLKTLGKSPAQLMINRSLRTKLPVTTKNLQPKIERNVKTMKEASQGIQKYYYDRGSKTLSPLRRGQTVVMKRGREWEPAVITKAHETPRSYILRTESQEYRRNRKDLRPSFNTPPKYNPTSLNDPIKNIPSSVPLQASYSSPTKFENDQIHDSSEVPASEDVDDYKLGRPVRIRHLPLKFKDFEM